MTSVSPIGDRVAEMHAAGGAEPPNDVMAVFGREQAALAATGPPTGIAEAGTVLADADLLDVHGAATTLYQATGGVTLVLVFYRGAWCPYCNIALSTYQTHLLPQLQEQGVRLVAISPQHPDGSLTMQEKHDLAFSVVSDPGNTVARALGIVTEPSSEARQAQLALGLDLTAVNADGSIELPMPSVAIVDSNYKLRFVDVHPNYSTRTEPHQILDALDRLVERKESRL